MNQYIDCRNNKDRDKLGLCAAGIYECYVGCPFYIVENPSMNFGQAIEALKAGKKVRRSGWNGTGMWLQLQVPDAHSKMTHPYIYIEYPGGPHANPNYPNGSRIPWLASQTDVLGEDWSIVE